MKWSMYNQDGQAVYEFTPMTIVPRRPEARAFANGGYAIPSGR